MVLPLGLLSATLVFWSAGLGWSYFWVRYQLHEAVVCLQDERNDICKSRFHHQVRRVTPYVQVHYVDLFSGYRRQTGHCQIKISFLGTHSMEFKKTITQ